MTESCPKKTNIAEISPHLICALCGGYLIDATTIVECLHSFCKTCIVRYLESSKYCPICEVLVHKTRPLQNIRLDHTLQDIVYKLVPGLFQSEMKRRREFYKDHETVRSAKVRQEQQRHRVIYSADEQFSISLEFCPDGRIRRPSGRKSRRLSSKTEAPERRYFLVPANTTVALLKKFMKLKFALPPKFKVDIFHDKGPLREHYSMMDVAYIYSWKREGVLQLYYSVYKVPDPIPEIRITEVKDDFCIDIADDTGQKADETGRKADDTRPSVLFNKATLLGNHSVDRNIPHDLSPLELIATVANDICIQEGRGFKPEGRGLKRKTEDAQLYENDDENSSTETRQLQKSIERAIDLCSNSRQGSPSCSSSASTTVPASSVQDTRAETLRTELHYTPTSSESSVKTSTSENIPVSSQVSDNVGDKTKAIQKVSDTTVVVKEKPKKMDTASQCDPRPKKQKGDGHLHNKSKTVNKIQTSNKDGKEARGVNGVERKVSGVNETKVGDRLASVKVNGGSIKGANGECVNNNNKSESHSSVNNVTKTEAETVKELPMKSETLKVKEQKSGPKIEPSIPKDKSSLKSDTLKTQPTVPAITPTSQVIPNSPNSATVSNRPMNAVPRAFYSAQPVKSSILQKTTSSTQNKAPSFPSKVPTIASPMKSQTKVTSAQTPNKLPSSPLKPATTTTTTPTKSLETVKSASQINGHSSPSEIAKQQNKTASLVKVAQNETKTTKP